MKNLLSKRGSISLLVILLFLLFIIVGSFTAGLIILTKSENDNDTESTKEGTAAYKEQTMENYAEKILTQPNEPDWNITYDVPTCYTPEGEGGLPNLGSIRIHWLDVKEGSVKGTQLAGDTKIVFTGTINGTHLTLTDKEFSISSMVKPFEITAEFNGTLSEFTGTYTAQYKMGPGIVPLPGCPADGSVSGPVSAKPIE